MVRGEFVALLVILTLPLKVLVVTGAKATLKVAVCPGAKPTGAVSPLTLKTASATATLDIATLEFPVLVSVTFWELLPFTVIFPKLKLVGFAAT
jgi:hypothetical protein